MKVQFWGTRGSLAKAGPSTVRYGGNTSCVEVRSSAGTLVVLDCGTGVQNLGLALMSDEPQPLRGHILISHTHWDHIQGIPFFAPLFEPGNEWDIYAPRGLSQSLRDTLAGQMQYTYFPVTLEALGATIRYHDLVEGIFEIGDIKVRTQYLNHPALTLGYRLEADGVSVVYACDHEPHSRHLAVGIGDIGVQDQRHVDFLGGADLVIHDAQYTEAEYVNKAGWGHSTFGYAVEMCRIAGAKRLALTHHDPLRDDDSVDRIQESARACLVDLDSPLEVFAAAEGKEIELGTVTDPAPSRMTAEFSAVTPVTPALWEHVILLGIADSTTAGMLSEAAQAENIQVLVEEDADSTLRVFKSDQPSLVILDEQLAGNNALEVCRAIRSLGDDFAREMPIIIVADEEDVAAGITASVTDWLIKPFSSEYARTRIRAWVLRNTCRWIRAPLPEDESRRLAALKKLTILDTEPEERFDRITRLAAAMFEVPIAQISLVDRDRQWFKSSYGLSAKETSREVSFCAHAVLGREVMVVPDAFLDPRFADSPLVTDESRIRFYAGCPLTLADESCVGTLCLFDIRPRQFDKTKISLLEDLGCLVEQELSVTSRS